MSTFLFLIALAAWFCVWSVVEWIEGKAKEAKERARRAQLDNEKLELEIAALKRARGGRDEA